MQIPQVRRLIIPESSANSERKYDVIPIMRSKRVSVIAEWVRILHHLNSKELNRPAARPIDNEAIAKTANLPNIVKGVAGVKLKSVLNPCTV